MKYWYMVAFGALSLAVGVMQKPKIHTRRLKGNVTGIGEDGAIHVTYQDGDLMYYAKFAPHQIPSYQPPKLGDAAQVIVPAARPAEPISMMLTRSRLKQPAFSLPTKGQSRFLMIWGIALIVFGILGSIRNY